MKTSSYTKIKKYLLLLSIFFSVFTATHISYVYLYDWAARFPVVWWTISVWYVWGMPSLNPLEFSLNPTNDYIIHFLFRSLLRYDSKTMQMEWDLANCDLWKDFSKIKCYIKSDEKWSDWQSVTKDDVIATYKAIKDTNINPPAKQLLENIEMEDKWDYIEFSSKNADVLLLDSFLMPIVKKDDIPKFTGDNKTPESSSTSWEYLIWKREFDSNYNVKKLTIIKRDSSTVKDTYISKYIFKFFPDSNSLTKNEDSLNIIFPDWSDKFLVSPRFLEYKYILPQYIWLFLNTEKISNIDLRKFLIFQLNNANYSEIIKPSTGKIISNPFFTNDNITPNLTNKNVASIFNSLWFYKKDFLVWEINKKYDTLLTPEKKSTEIPFNTFFKTPSDRKIYFHTGSPEILLSWNVPAWVEWIYINDYKLSSFMPWNTKFYFRAKTEYKTLVPWANTYTLFFEISGKKFKKETLTVYYYENKDQLEAKKKEIEENLSKTEELTAEQKAKIEKDKAWELQRIANLDPIFYYDKNLIKFKLTLDYSNNTPTMWALANKIKSELKLIWIDLDIKWIDQKWLETIIYKWEKNYDILLTWINHGLYYYNISPFFHSWQAKLWFNFSKIKDVSLDLLLEKLKASALTQSMLTQIEKEALVVIQRSAVVKTFYSPYNTFFIDKNIKNISEINMVPYSFFSSESIKNSYIKEDRVIDYSNKSTSWFLDWIKTKM